MTIARTGSLAVAALLALVSGREAMADPITVGGSVASPTTFDSGSFGGTTVSANGDSYGGTSLYSLISTAKFQSPAQVNGNPNGALLDYLLITSTSGSRVVVSEGEIDPGFGGHADIIANTRNGGAIAPQLIVPGDLNGGIGGRDIGGVASISVLQATRGPGTTTGGASTQLGVTGNVSTPATYTSLSAFPSTTETVSYKAGSATTTATFTGAQIYTVLSASGLSTNPASLLADYVVATGSDGYAVVYSLAELDPDFFANPAGEPLVASVGGSSGAFRSTAPGDAKGGRYVSNLQNLNVVNAVPEPASLALLASPLLAGVLARRRRRSPGTA